MSETNYFESGGEAGVCTKCGHAGQLKRFPGSPNEWICERCRKWDWIWTGAFVLLLYVVIPIGLITFLIVRSILAK